jgi:DNA mismatch repair protein MutL
MTDIIKLLPDNVANQIAAGEVVQRPASVIKELMENAVDSGATEIAVTAKDAGKTLVQIVDNGCGMSATDARVSFERHSTSKIRDINDLFQIHTMGFRGEALASIAAVATVTLKTRLTDDQLGTEIEVSGTKVNKQEPVSCPVGSNFMVKNLFFNVPARRKFLKTNTTELKHIISEFQRIALANPHIKFSLKHNNTAIYDLPKAPLKQRIINIFGKTMNNQLVNIDSSTTSIVKIHGYVCKPEFAKKTSSEQFFFVNDRFMKHHGFHRAIMNAYDNLISPGTTPSYFIYFDVDPKTIDINIHPTKTEIKFIDERTIFQFLQSTVKKSLGISNFMPSIDFETSGIVDIPGSKKQSDFTSPEINLNKNYNPFSENSRTFESQGFSKKDDASDWQDFYKSIESKVIDSNVEKQESLTFNIKDQKRFIQLKTKYIITYVKSGLMIIDQQRAHQRILFEKFIQNISEDNSVSQKQLFAEKVELTSGDYTLTLELKEELYKLGMEITDFGNNTIVVNSIPSDSKNKNAELLLRELIETYKQTEMDLKVNARENLARALSVASSIKYGKTLNLEEMDNLTNELFSCKDHSFSPFGKPIISILGIEEIDKKF